jgi:hypothetical protein
MAQKMAQKIDKVAPKIDPYLHIKTIPDYIKKCPSR